MNELIKINNSKVSGRELHEFLQIETRYNDWFERMREYGFVEGIDFYSKMSKTSPQGGRPSIDHEMTIDMAKEISMIQRNERGKQARLYFIECEKRLKGKPLSQVEILAQAAQQLVEQERELARLRLDTEEIRKEQKIQASRIDTFNCVCTEGAKRQKLVAMIQAYAAKNGLTYREGWHRFKAAYNTAFRTSLGNSISYYMKEHGLKKKPSVPEFLETKGLLDDALRVADKMLNGAA